MPKGIPLAPGVLVHERYRIERLIATGGMGRIYEVYHVHLDQHLALKEIVPDNPHDSQQIQQAQYIFLQEGHILSTLDDPHLPKIYDAFKDNERFFLVMDYIEGQTLASIQMRRGPIPVQDVLPWLIQLCDVLNVLHWQNPPVIFRDLKPGNIILQPDNTLKLIDFGIARLFQAGQTHDTMDAFTAGFSPPEQFSGHGQTDQRSDIYALGKTAWSLLTGLNPADERGGMFQLRPPAQIIHSISPELNALIMHMVEMDPTKRPASVVEVRRRLLDIPLTSPPSPRGISRRQLLIGGGMVMGVFLIGTGAFEWLRRVGSSNPSTGQKSSATGPTGSIYNQNGCISLSLTEALSDTNYVGHTYNINMQDGKLLWSDQGGYESSVLIAHDVVYLNTGDNVQALQLKNGTQIWQIPESSGINLEAVDTNFIYSLTGNVPGNTQVQALHINDGSTAWQQQINGPTLPVSQFIITDSVIYLGTSTSPFQVDALRTGDGSSIWQYQADAPVYVQAVNNGVAYAIAAPAYESADGGGPNYGDLYALRITDGSLLWQYRMNPLGSLTVTNNVVCINNGSFYALHENDGTVLWQQTHEGNSVNIASGDVVPIVADNIMYSVAGDGTLYAVQVQDGTLLWHYPVTTSGGTFSLFVESGVVYLCAGTIVALQASDGHLLWQSYTPANGAELAGGIVYGYTTNSSLNKITLYALRSHDGKLLWNRTIQTTGQISNVQLAAGFF